MLQEKSFRAGSVTINYAEGPPSGPPLVLLHGINNRWQAFLPLIPALALRWHIYALDFRGYGKSDRVPGQYQAQDYVTDTVAFLRDHVQDPAVLFGHSLGGVIALWVAARIPDAVQALVLGDNIIFLDSLQESTYAGSLFAGLRDLLQQGHSVEKLAAALAEIPAPLPGRETPVRWGEHPGMDAAFLRYLAKAYSQSDPEVLTMVLDGRVAEGYEPERLLRQIVCPVLLLQANPALGATMSNADVSRARALLAHAIHVRFEQLGHFLHLEQAGPVLRTVTNFLESL